MREEGTDVTAKAAGSVGYTPGYSLTVSCEAIPLILMIEN